MASDPRSVENVTKGQWPSVHLTNGLGALQSSLLQKLLYIQCNKLGNLEQPV